MIAVRGLEYTYADGTHALRGVDLSIARGERLALLGSNGSGKTSLFLCLTGILKPTAGEVVLGGEPVTYDRKGLTQLRSRIGFVFQDPDSQIFCVDVFQEVAFGPANMGLGAAEVEARTQRAMEWTDVSGLSRKPPHFLSQGQKKRVTAASALSMEPDVLLFDEPTSALDPRHAAKLMEIIEAMSRRGVTVCLSTHDMDLAYAWADRVAVLSEGKVLAAGAPEDVMTDEQVLARADLHPPQVVRVYRALAARGFVDGGAGGAPRTVEQLEALLEGGKHAS
ncbi:MAG: ATP-binding cassette domain-containing protein [Clostridiales Family XIII bacterium]|jgi:cobalt/nickel transport system ATP-binding protein|nr:ATP-binding cassette domain-containing protein [Clostridiales Family XIII bacterium]